MRRRTVAMPASAHIAMKMTATIIPWCVSALAAAKCVLPDSTIATTHAIVPKANP
jgi:hypothetical protein